MEPITFPTFWFEPTDDFFRLVWVELSADIFNCGVFLAKIEAEDAPDMNEVVDATIRHLWEQGTNASSFQDVTMFDAKVYDVKFTGSTFMKTDLLFERAATYW